MHAINAILTPIQRRLWYRQALRTAMFGCMGGSLLAVGIVAACWLVDAPQHALWLAVLAVASGTILGCFAGLSRPPSLRRAAETVDEYYAENERTVTALAFAAQADDDPLKRLQIADTLAHLQKVRPSDCVPLTVSPANKSLAAGLLGLAAALVATAQWTMPTAEATRPIPLAEQQAELLRDSVVAEVEELAAETGSEELRQLSEKLQQLTDALQHQTSDQESYFATLSEMEQAIEQSRAAMQRQEKARRLEEIAAAIKPAAAMRKAAEAIEAEQYQQAAEELEAVDPAELTDQERRAVADNLKDMQPTEDEPNAPRDSIRRSAEQLQQALEEKNADQARDATQELASAAQQQAVAKAIEKSLDRQMNRLSDAKGKGRNQGQTPSELAQKTDSSSQTWGKAASGNPQDGQPQSVDVERQRQELTGQKGEGASEMERVESTATEQTAQRQYVEQYQEFRRQAEAVLESEPLPIGQRETIRRYFESIRPEPVP